MSTRHYRNIADQELLDLERNQFAKIERAFERAPTSTNDSMTAMVTGRLQSEMTRAPACGSGGQRSAWITWAPWVSPLRGVGR